MSPRDPTSDITWPVTVRKMGRSIFDPIWAQREHVDVYSELIYVLRGKVRIETPTYSVSGQAGDTLFTPANTPHKDVFPRDSIFEVYLVQLHWTEAATFLKKFHPVELTEAARSSRARFGQAFNQLYREFIGDLAFARPMVAMRVGQILYELCRAAAMRKRTTIDSPDQITRQRRQQIMEGARRHIDQSLHEPISLDVLADAVGVSPYYLSRVFSQESGFTLSSYITQARMALARRLLADTRMTIKEVACRTGYRDSHYFARVFRNWLHVSPSDYRRQLGGRSVKQPSPREWTDTV